MELKLDLSPQSVGFLYQSAKWAKLISIVHFIFAGIIVISSLIMFAGANKLGVVLGASMPGSIGAILGVFYLAAAALVIIQASFLYGFATRTINAVRDGNSEILQEGLEKMKSYWKFVGIVTIVSLVFCALALIISIITSIAVATAF